ncbi:NTP transferase domain-containing protein [Nocardioides hwasunensis]|uniref:NTP transferase domain-containing protein n=1 Tax=Nocardioides hwasunensis TaxID=397258 RepID=A0ABR8MJ80_9ACTN|nr:NTP transferase domain-containing protein [Nocardioides hwasunensis]MBD3915640.1 NTP transferase domain-containing protein [Nocardioides hwasunensis]
MAAAAGAGASAVVLAKDSRIAKTRLGLDVRLTREVALQLAASTVRAALGATTIGQVVVVTSDPAIARDSRRVGARVVLEPRPLGLVRAASLGRHRALEWRPRSPVVLMVADLPRLASYDLDRVVTSQEAACRPVFVPDRDGVGTTALLHGADVRPGIAFGPESASRHRGLGYTELLDAPSGMREDLDTPDDLHRSGLVVAGREVLAAR